MTKVILPLVYGLEDDEGKICDKIFIWGLKPYKNWLVSFWHHLETRFPITLLISLCTFFKIDELVLVEDCVLGRKTLPIAETRQRDLRSDIIQYQAVSSSILKKKNRLPRYNFPLIFSIFFEIMQYFSAENSFLFLKQQTYKTDFSQNPFFFKILTSFFFALEQNDIMTINKFFFFWMMCLRISMSLFLKDSYPNGVFFALLYQKILAVYVLWSWLFNNNKRNDDKKQLKKWMIPFWRLITWIYQRY